MFFPHNLNLAPIANLSTAYNLLLSSTIRKEVQPVDDSPTDTMSFTHTPAAPLVACLESYINPALPIGTSLSTDANSPALHIIPSPTLAKLKNLGPARVKDMRTLGHSKQIVSHIPITATPATCAKFNDALYVAIQLNAGRFAALALLPGEGKEAAKELQRCVTKMRFVGGLVGLRGGEGEALLDGGFEELWSTAEKSRVPIALREMWPTGGEVCYASHS